MPGAIVLQIVGTVILSLDVFLPRRRLELLETHLRSVLAGDVENAPELQHARARWARRNLLLLASGLAVGVPFGWWAYHADMLARSFPAVLSNVALWLALWAMIRLIDIGVHSSFHYVWIAAARLLLAAPKGVLAAVGTSALILGTFLQGW